jgi:hypothetical protein
MGIVLEEADETLFWIELLEDTGILKKGGDRAGEDRRGFPAHRQGFEERGSTTR